VAKGVTMHGFAINCDCALDAFARIVPCGISDAAVTTLSLELGRPVTVAEIVPLVERHLAAAIGATAISHGSLELAAPAVGGAA
jgi:lipoyl(octanoyl) transferase